MPRARLMGVLRNAVNESKKFNDYNFRCYFVNKFETQLHSLEKNASATVSQEMIDAAEKELAIVARQAAVQKLYSVEPTVVEHMNSNN